MSRKRSRWCFLLLLSVGLWSAQAQRPESEHVYRFGAETHRRLFQVPMERSLWPLIEEAKRTVPGIEWARLEGDSLRVKKAKNAAWEPIDSAMRVILGPDLPEAKRPGQKSAPPWPRLAPPSSLRV